MPLNDALKFITTVFIDRDGVINKDSKDYIKSVDEFFFIDGSKKAFKSLYQNNIDAIIITNQSVIGRKMVSHECLGKIFKKMTLEVEQSGGKIKDIFFCPHTPDANCSCRKPKPGMIFAAKKKHSVNLQSSAMIGDSAKDIECAINAGVGKTILVKTGNGEKALGQLMKKNIFPDFIADNLLAATEWIISRNKTRGESIVKAD